MLKFVKILIQVKHFMLVAETTKSLEKLSQLSNRPLRLVALGDSTIYGFGDPEGGGWVERLRREWMSPESPGHILYNLGVRGDRAEQVGQRLENEFHYRGELRNTKPDAIILSVGTNDSARVQKPDGRNLTDFEKFNIDINNLLDTAKDLSQVFFVGMVPVDASKMPFLGCMYYNHAEQYRYKEATRLACLRRDIPYLDIFEKWLNRGDRWWMSRICEDGLHPNVDGYKALFNDVSAWEPLAELTRTMEKI